MTGGGNDEASLIDTAVVADMIAAMRPGVFAEIVRSLMDDHAGRMVRLRAAGEIGNLAGIASEAHDLASTLGSFGGTEANALARQLMAAARAGDRSQATLLLPNVLRTADATVAALAAYIARTSNGGASDT